METECEKARRLAKKYLGEAVDNLDKGNYPEFQRNIKVAIQIGEGIEKARCPSKIKIE